MEKLVLLRIYHKIECNYKTAKIFSTDEEEEAEEDEEEIEEDEEPNVEEQEPTKEIKHETLIFESFFSFKKKLLDAIR